MNKQLGVIVPYFGPLPKTFKAWVRSLKINPNVTYFLITDQKHIMFRSVNLVVINMTFKDLQIRLKRMLNINLKSPYKLCDLKPAYGHVFNDILKDFDYWGYSDLDLAFGNLHELLIKVKNNNHHKTFTKGHFSMYKNIPEINDLFKIKRHNNKWKYIKNSKIIWVFDENYFGDIIGINGLILNENKNIYDDVSLYSDINPNKLGFFNLNNNNNNNSFYYLTDLDLIEVSYDPISNLFNEKTLVYVHYQKRMVRVNDLVNGLMLIYPFHWKRINSLEDCKKALKDNYILDDNVNKVYASSYLHSKKIKLIYLFSEILNFDLMKILSSKIMKMIFKVFLKKIIRYNKT